MSKTYVKAVLASLIVNAVIFGVVFAKVSNAIGWWR